MELEPWRASFGGEYDSTRWPYGAEMLTAQRGWQLRDARQMLPRRDTKFRRLVHHRTGLPLDLGRAALRTPGSGVLALLETEGMSLALMPRRRPNATFSCWLAERIQHATKRQRSEWRFLMRRLDLVLTWSRNQLPILAEFGLEPDRLASVPLGVDTDFFRPGLASGSIDVLAVGNDVGRDYETLFEAVRTIDATVHVVCSEERLRGLTLPNNLVHHGPVDHVKYRELLRSAKVVVVPTHELAYPTGQSVALEAMAVGRCVVVTGTAPMREYLTHGVDSLMVTPGDPHALREAIVSALGDDELRGMLQVAARMTVTTTFTFADMWREVGNAIDEAFSL